MKNVLLWLILGVTVAACDRNVTYSDYEDLPDGQWFVKNAPTFTFQIDDASVPYNLYYNLRNSRAYPYYNLYLTRYVLDSAGRTLESRLDEVLLMDPKTGQPRGDGLGDIYDHRILMKANYRFPKPGQYVIRLKQYMRQDPLPEILSVGVSVEKATASPRPQ